MKTTTLTIEGNGIPSEEEINPDKPQDYNNEYEKIVCRCGNDKWEVFYTHSYETSVKCDKCGFFVVVHSG